MRQPGFSSVITGGLLWLVLTLHGCNAEAEFSGFSGPGPSGGNPAPTPTPEPDDTPVDEPAPGTEDAVPELTSLSREFPAARIARDEASFRPEYRLFTQDLTLREMPPTTANLKQIARTLVTDPFKQGHDGMRAEEEPYSVSEAGKLDLLVVVDDSTSMSSEHQNLASKLDPLLSSINNTDWQIGVITTSDPCLRNGKPIKKGDADAAQAFSNAILVPLDDTVIEKGFPMMIRALKEECNSWIRPQSTIAVLILSDEDNCGSHAGEGCPGEEGETVAQTLAFLESFRPAGQARVYGIFEGPGNPCGSAAFEAVKYKEVVEATGGSWGSICVSDYTNTLRQISQDVARIVKREFILTHEPDAGSLVLDIDGRPITDGYTVNGKSLIIDNVNPDDMQLKVSYTYGTTPKYSRFLLSEVPDVETLEVTIDSQKLDADDFTYDEQTGEIVFAQEPVDDAEIAVRYRKFAPLPKEFSLGNADVLGDLVEVKVAGTAVTDYTFDPATNKVSFMQAPPDEADVAVTFRTKSGRVVEYAPSIMDAMDALAIYAEDPDAQTMVPVTLSGDKLVFDPEDVVDGRKVRITYDLGYAPDALVFDLNYEPLADTLTVDTDQGPEACADAYVVGRTVNLGCDAGDVGEVRMAYEYVAERHETFALEGEIPSTATWKVWVDGQEITDYRRNGNEVTIPRARLRLDSVVKLEATFPKNP